MMALKGAALWWVCVKTPCSDLGASDLSSSCSGFVLNLRCDLGRFRKWECNCLSFLAKKAIAPIEGEKPCMPGADLSGAIGRTQDNRYKEFHKDMHLLPSEFSQFIPL